MELSVLFAAMQGLQAPPAPQGLATLGPRARLACQGNQEPQVRACAACSS